MPPHPTRTHRQWVTIALTWVTAVATTIAWAKTTRIGPVIYTISEHHGWGIHTGDAWALLGIAAATIITARVRTRPVPTEVR